MHIRSGHKRNRPDALATVARSALVRAMASGVGISLAGLIGLVALGGSPAGAVSRHTAAAAPCVGPVSLHLDKKGNATGNTKKFAFHTTSARVKPPRYDVIGAVSVNSSTGTVTSLTGTNSDGSSWTGTRVNANLWNYDTPTEGVAITTATAHGCFGSPSTGGATSPPTVGNCQYRSVITTNGHQSGNGIDIIAVHPTGQDSQGRLTGFFGIVNNPYQVSSITGTDSTGIITPVVGPKKKLTYNARNNGYIVKLTFCASDKTTTPPAASAGDSTTHPGSAETITGSGFAPGEKVKAVLHSAARLLGTFTASTTGKVSVTFTVPSGIAAGSHHVILTGQTSGRVAKAYFSVSPAAASTGGGGSGGLANTGSLYTGQLLWAGLIAIIGGFALVVAGGTARGRRTR